MWRKTPRSWERGCNQFGMEDRDTPALASVAANKTQRLGSRAASPVTSAPGTSQGNEDGLKRKHRWANQPAGTIQSCAHKGKPLACHWKPLAVKSARMWIFSCVAEAFVKKGVRLVRVSRAVPVQLPGLHRGADPLFSGCGVSQEWRRGGKRRHGSNRDKQASVLPASFQTTFLTVCTFRISNANFTQ